MISHCRSIRPVEIHQYDITMAIHYDITMGSDIARDVHYEITMGNDVARDKYCDVTMSNDIAMCTYHGITMHNDIAMTQLMCSPQNSELRTQKYLFDLIHLHFCYNNKIQYNTLQFIGGFIFLLVKEIPIMVR